MRVKIIMVSCMILSAKMVAGQSNTFPSSGNVGIGTTSPAYSLDVNGNIHTNGQFIGNADQPIILRGSGTALYTQSAIYNTTSYFMIDIARIGNSKYYNAIDFILSGRGGPNILVREGSTGNFLFNNTSGNTIFKIGGNGDVGIGTETPQSKLAVNGTVTAKQVKVTQTGWPDYVFDTAYTLASLEKTAAYLKANHHLPDIPSAKEIGNKGLDLGDMQQKQMRKIEELTLYTIDQEKQLKSQKQLIAQLTEALLQQEKRITKLEKKLSE